MTALARPGRPHGWRKVARPAALLLVITIAPSPASAAGEVGLVVSAYTDQRFRGYSLSDGRPVGILDLSFDSPDGIYAAVSGTVVATRAEGAEPLGIALNAGFAKPVSRALTLDLGAVHSSYSRYSGLVGTRSYTEAYAGISSKVVGARLSLSPNYIGPTHWTLHGEINGHVELVRSLLLDGSVGILAPLGSHGYWSRAHPLWDARVGLSKRLGPVQLHAAITARGNSSQIYVNHRHGRAALVLGISSAL